MSEMSGEIKSVMGAIGRKIGTAKLGNKLRFKPGSKSDTGTRKPAFKYGGKTRSV